MVKAALAQGIAEGDKKCAEVLPEIVDFEGEGHQLKQLESTSFQTCKSFLFLKHIQCVFFFWHMRTSTFLQTADKDSTEPGSSRNQTEYSGNEI